MVVRPGDGDGGAGLFPAREVASRLRCRCPRTLAPGAALTGRDKHPATAIRQRVRPRTHVAASGRSAGRIYTQQSARATHDHFTQSVTAYEDVKGQRCGLGSSDFSSRCEENRTPLENLADLQPRVASGCTCGRVFFHV